MTGVVFCFFFGVEGRKKRKEKKLLDGTEMRKGHMCDG